MGVGRGEERKRVNEMKRSNTEAGTKRQDRQTMGAMWCQVGGESRIWWGLCPSVGAWDPLAPVGSQICSRNL